jgi:hypothetical protein
LRPNPIIGTVFLPTKENTVMANKSSRSPSGEEPEQNKFIRPQEVQEDDISANSGKTKSSTTAGKGQENLTNRGFQEDQPGNPVRTTGSTTKDQETLPTGEPDQKESKRP